MGNFRRIRFSFVRVNEIDGGKFFINTSPRPALVRFAPFEIVRSYSMRKMSTPFVWNSLAINKRTEYKKDRKAVGRFQR